MNTEMMRSYSSPTGGQNLPPLTEELIPLFDQMACERFARMRFQVLRRAMGEEFINEGLWSDGSFLLEGVTVVMRHDEQSANLELYADLGLPEESCDLPAIYGELLESNLCHRFEPRIFFGRHPESKRLVAFFTGNLFMFDEDGELCLMVLQMLVNAVKEVRNW